MFIKPSIWKYLILKEVNGTVIIVPKDLDMEAGSSRNHSMFMEASN